MMDSIRLILPASTTNKVESSSTMGLLLAVALSSTESVGEKSTMLQTRRVSHLLLLWTGVLCLIHPSSGLLVPAKFRSSRQVWSSPSALTALSMKEDTQQSSKGDPPRTFTPLIDPKDNKLRRLRDLMWVREALEDLTQAEFAINLDQTTGNDQNRRRKRAVDFENILGKLNKRIMDLACEPIVDATCDLEEIKGLTPTKGFGRTVFTEEKREELFNRFVQARHLLMETMRNHGGDVEEDELDKFSLSLPEINIEIPKEEGSSDAVGPKLYLRDDGTVDWDGALQDQAALKNFGTAVWARINGRDPASVGSQDGNDSEEEIDETPERPAVTAKIEETDEIRREKELLDRLETEYKAMERDHVALLNSAISAGQAVANINFATLDPALRRKINDSSSHLEKKREEVVYQRLIYELERIFTYLSGELGNPSSKGYIPLQDRLNVAEFGLLESQVSSFKTQLEAGEMVDADVLAVVSEQVTDFKRRLGIDFYVTGLTFDREAILLFSRSILEKTRRGVAFYVKGTKLFWNDIVFATSLIIRALQGYTLKPREVRNLRRTFKDLVTFIPVVIILLIPLSPVGHVLVFGAIQRVFPDFFPSCFTERRQNLLELYESAEYSEVTINEPIREKIARFLEAFFFQIAKIAKKAYSSLRGGGDGDSQS